MWFLFALLSAIFAALTSILAKIGIDGVNSNLATAIRTIVVLIASWGDGIHHKHSRWNNRNKQEKLDLLDSLRPSNRSIMAMLLSSSSARRCI